MRSTRVGWRSPLAKGIESFLAHKRALGRRFDVEERTLQLLDRFLVEQKVDEVGKITPDLLETFLASRPRKKPRSYNHLLGTVARLLNWMVLQGLLIRTPLCVKPRRQSTQQTPFLFDPPMARRLLELAGSLPDNDRAIMRGRTYRTIFALLYGLGLRVGEACRLCHMDVDLNRQLLVIRKTKFAKDRLVPFGPRIGAVLGEYLQARQDRCGPFHPEAPVFSFSRNRPINPCTVSQIFHKLILRLDLDVPHGCAPPRLHHLRHSFAVGTLLRWYRSGIDPQARLVRLSTFLGHANPVSSAVYLTITDNLLTEANLRFEQFARAALEEKLS